MADDDAGKWSKRGRIASFVAVAASILALGLSKPLFVGQPDTGTTEFAVMMVTWMISLFVATVGGLGGLVIWIIDLRKGQEPNWTPVLLFVAITIAVSISVNMWYDSLDFSFF